MRQWLNFDSASGKKLILKLSRITHTVHCNCYKLHWYHSWPTYNIIVLLTYIIEKFLKACIIWGTSIIHAFEKFISF